MHGAYCCQHPHCVTLSPAAPTQCLYIMTYSTGVRLKTPTVKSQMEILVWNSQKCSCQVLIVWSLITDVCHQSPGMRHCHCWESEMPIIPRMMHWDQCWQSTVRPLVGHLGQTLASHWPILWWILFTLGTKVKMMSLKNVLAESIPEYLALNTRMAISQFNSDPVPMPWLFTEYRGLSDGSPLLAAPDTNHFN